MNKGINVLWIGLVLLCLVAILLSQQACVMFVPKRIEGLPIFENGQYISFSGEPIDLPEPSYRTAYRLVLRCSLICIVAFLFRSVIINVLGTLVAVFQALSTCFFAQIHTLFAEMRYNGSPSPGTVVGDYTMEPIGCVVGMLCVLIAAYSVFLTTINIRKNVKNKHKLLKGENKNRITLYLFLQG